MMNGQTKLVCVEAGLGIAEGLVFHVLGENGSVWEILLGGEYRKVNKVWPCAGLEDRPEVWDCSD